MGKYIKPTSNTKFHIDFHWWKKRGNGFNSFLADQGCPEIARQAVANNEQELFDWINPETGEVFQIDLQWHQIRQHCLERDDFITEYTPLTTAVFRAFVVNNNTPLNSVELYHVIQKQSPDVILNTIGNRTIHYGIRPAKG